MDALPGSMPGPSCSEAGTSGDCESSAVKKPRYSCKFQDSWLQEFNFVCKSAKGIQYARCKACGLDFSIGNGGRTDVKKHSQTSNHASNMKSYQSTSRITKFIARGESECDKVINKFAYYLAKNNMPFSACDEFSRMVGSMFPDSTIAKKYGMGKTKGTQIIKGALAPFFNDKVIKQCQNQPYGLMCDGSNDRAEKTFAILVRVFDEDLGEVKSRFVDMPVSNIGTAEKLFECIQDSFSKLGIPWENLLAYNSDNASVRKGRHNSVLSRIRGVQPSIFDLGCICHLANLSVGVGMKEVPLPVEDFLVDIYFHFEKSCKRKEIFKEFQDFSGIEFQKIIKHCSTRWLSLLNCIQCIISQWPALKSYFLSHEDVEKVGRVQTYSVTK